MNYEFAENIEYLNNLFLDYNNQNLQNYIDELQENLPNSRNNVPNESSYAKFENSQHTQQQQENLSRKSINRHLISEKTTPFGYAKQGKDFVNGNDHLRSIETKTENEGREKLSNDEEAGSDYVDEDFIEKEVDIAKFVPIEQPLKTKNRINTGITKQAKSPVKKVDSNRTVESGEIPTHNKDNQKEVEGKDSSKKKVKTKKEVKEENPDISK